jgi:hypothetical protein
MDRKYKVSSVWLINNKNISVRVIYANTFKLGNTIHLLPTLIIKNDNGVHVQFAWIIFKFSLSINIYRNR